MRWAMALLVVFTSWTALAQAGDQVAGGEEIGNKILSFIQTAAELLGQGLVNLINRILPPGHEISADLEIPLGYLGLLTVVLLLFGMLEAARKVIWIVVGVGWALMVVRIILEALRI